MENELYTSSPFTARGGFTSGIEGPACDREGNLYAVNYERRHTIGRVAPDGECSVFLELPNGSVANGIRFNRAGDMLIADYTNHNLLKADMRTKALTVVAHEPRMNQPNDIAIADDDTVFASDPNWKQSTGNLWRIRPNGDVALLESSMGTTNGIEVAPDNRTLYVNETVQRRVWAYELSEDGDISGKRLLIEFPDFGMDGMRCDVDGNLYITRFGKGTIAKVSPSGELLTEIRLHGTNCTNLAFGGVDGKTCYVTMADTGSIERFRVESPGREWALSRR